jgi:hypothetical protein
MAFNPFEDAPGTGLLGHPYLPDKYSSCHKTRHFRDPGRQLANTAADHKEFQRPLYKESPCVDNNNLGRNTVMKFTIRLFFILFITDRIKPLSAWLAYFKK